MSSSQFVKTVVWEVLDSIGSRWHLESGVDTAVVVVVDVPINRLDHLPDGLEAIEVT